MNLIKTTAKTLVFLLSLACALVPFVVWATDPQVSQWNLFGRTWMWLFYAVIVYLLGFTFINGLFNRSE